jgi:glycosyltransferase involved in cell wall biosynthesis
VELLYISNGNIPSRWAHTFQTMKMSEAYRRLVRGFSLLIGADIYHRFRSPVDLWDWYGIRTPFSVLRLPLAWRREPVIRRDSDRRFNLFAPACALLLRPKLVITRSPSIALRCLRLRLPTLYESHAVPRRSLLPAINSIVRHPSLSGLVTVSDVVRAALVTAGAAEEAVLVAPNGVDLELFDGIHDRLTARRRHGLPADGDIVVYTGHLYDYKGIGTLLDSAARLPESLFVLVGGWPEDVERLQRQASSLNNVRFVGFVPNHVVAEYLSAADVCVHPHSARDQAAEYTSPLKLLEYMAAGRPVVATDIRALRGLLTDEHNALVVPPDDAVVLSDAIRRLFDDRHLGERLARQAREDVARRTWDARARKVLDRFVPGLQRRVSGE